MRTQYYVLHRCQWRAWAERFSLENVERGAADFTALQSFNQRPFIYDRSAGCIDEHGICFHQSELWLADQATGLRREWTVDQDVVGCAQKFFERHQLYSELRGPLGGNIGIKSQESANVKRAQQTDRLSRDVAHADRAHDPLARLPPKSTGTFCPQSPAHQPVLDH